MSEMIERAAEAIHVARCKMLHVTSPWDKADEATKETARTLARAAIEALDTQR